MPEIIVSDIYGVVLEDGQVNAPLWAWYTAQKAAGVRLYAGSNVPAEVAAKLMEQPAWAALFDGFYASGAIGVRKPQEGFFLHIEKDLALMDPTGVLFIDDTLDNVLCARHLGWQGYHYRGWPQMKEDFDTDDAN